MENAGSEPGGQDGFAESEIKSWLSMDTEIYCFHIGNVRSEPSGQDGSETGAE